jgi:predicted RNA-binding Zn ribbon-like protein
MEQLFLAAHRALDFLNTAREPGGERIETLPDGRAFAGWLVSAGLIEAAAMERVARRCGARGLDAAAAEARRFREWTREWLLRWRRAPRADYSREIAALNRVLAREVRNREVRARSGGFELVDVEHFEDAAALVALPAGDVAALIAREDPQLVRECAGDACTLWFLDRTKSHRRRFCSAAVCGNRAKVAAFRERLRGTR